MKMSCWHIASHDQSKFYINIILGNWFEWDDKFGSISFTICLILFCRDTISISSIMHDGPAKLTGRVTERLMEVKFEVFKWWRKNGHQPRDTTTHIEYPKRYEHFKYSKCIFEPNMNMSRHEKPNGKRNKTKQFSCVTIIGMCQVKWENFCINFYFSLSVQSRPSCRR